MTDPHGLTGLQQMEMIRDGVAPRASIQDTLGFELAEVGEGRTVFTYAPSDRHLNPLGTVHGGIAMTLLDSAAGASVHTTLAPGFAYTTLETKVNMTGAIRLDGGPLRAEGRVLHRGRTTAVAEARLVDGDDRLIAHATSTCLIMAR